MLSWEIFRHYLLSRRSGALVRVVAWHCILGMAMGVAALVVVLSVMNGFNITIRNRMFGVDPHLVIKEKLLPPETTIDRLTRRLSSVASHGVESLVKYEAQDVILRSGDGVFAGAQAKGYSDSALRELIQRVNVNAMSYGAPEESLQLGNSEIILGIDLARSLGVFEGDEILVIPPETLLLPPGEIPRFQKSKVKALLNTQMPEFDSKLMFYNLNKMSSHIRSASRESGFEVRLNDPYDAEEVKQGLQKLGIPSETWADRDSSLFFALKMESMAMTLFLSLAVLITSFSIVTLMVLLMSQKRQDIGMLMALGLSLKRARLTFLKVGLLLSGLGAGSGLLVGVLVSLFLEWYPLNLMPDIYTDSTLPSKLTVSIVLFVVGSSAFIALVGSALPVWRYALAMPAEALRRHSR